MMIWKQKGQFKKQCCLKKNTKFSNWQGFRYTWCKRSHPLVTECAANGNQANQPSPVFLGPHVLIDFVAFRPLTFQ